MKFVVAITLCFFAFLTAALMTNKVATQSDKQKSIQEYVDGKVHVVVIDNCQYIATQINPLILTHKGNCTNCTHKH